MNPKATLRLRRLTAILAVAWAAVAFLLCLELRLTEADAPRLPFELENVAGVSLIVSALEPEAAGAGVEVGDFLTAIDGRSIDQWMPRLRSLLRPGEPNAYRFWKRNGDVLEVALAARPAPGELTPGMLLGLAIPVLAGTIYFAVGMGVWRLRRDREEAWAFLLFCCATAAEIFLGGPQNPVTWQMNWVNAALLGATSFHLFTTYPIEPDWIVRHRRVRVLPYLGALVLSGLALLNPWIGANPYLLSSLILFFSLGLVGAGIGMLAVERSRLGSAEAASRADIVLVGALVSFVPVATLMLAQVFLRVATPWWLMLLFLLVFPLAVGYGIVRKQLFDIRMVAKSSVAYGASSIAITGLFALLIVFANTVVSRFNVDASSAWFQVAFLFVAILAFNPLRERLQEVVDRIFDRDRAGYRRAVREISEAMVSMLSIKEIVDRILVAVTDTMGVERAIVLLLSEEERRLRQEASRGEWDPDALALELPVEHPICKHLWMRREELSRLDFDDEPDPEVRDACRDVFDTLEVELLVPILFGVDLLGVIGVGRKLSGDRLGVDDRQLLRTLANQSSIAIENAKAFDEIAKLNETLEARVEERTHELQKTQEQLLQSEKMRSLGQLVAGVAHEINNPIGFVHANLQLLQEYMERWLRARERGEDAQTLQEAIAKLLARSREGTERVKKIVQDLRTFSRMDSAEVSEADLHEEIERTLTLMEPRFKDGVNVVRDFDAGLPRVRCLAGQLNQVFMNLLMNSCDALEGRGTIRLRSRRTKGGVRLEFSDDGPGIPAEVQSRIFEPFFTTKPVGQGTGLGLSLSHGIIERHGGRMLVSSTPGEGATFIIELPLQPSLESPETPAAAAS
jgi:signal transduction histidine kinase